MVYKRFISLQYIFFKSHQILNIFFIKNFKH